jgi:hypothetical protein
VYLLAIRRYIHRLESGCVRGRKERRRLSDLVHMTSSNLTPLFQPRLMPSAAYARLPTDSDTIPLTDRAFPGPRDPLPENTPTRSFVRLGIYLVGVLAIALASFRLGQLSVVLPPHEAPSGSEAAPVADYNTSHSKMGDKLSVG